MKRAMTLFLMTALLFSIASGAISHINPSQKANAQFSNAATASCQKLPIASITASGNDGNVPANVLDNNLNIRWSNLGVGSFIQADLGGQKTICSVDIAWDRGNLRENNFVISVSNDGTSFTNVFTGKSSGTTLSAEVSHRVAPAMLMITMVQIMMPMTGMYLQMSWTIILTPDGQI